jgi:hypothetical protein
VACLSMLLVAASCSSGDRPDDAAMPEPATSDISVPEPPSTTVLGGNSDAVAIQPSSRSFTITEEQVVPSPAPHGAQKTEEFRAAGTSRENGTTFEFLVYEFADTSSRDSVFSANWSFTATSETTPMGGDLRAAFVTGTDLEHTKRVRDQLGLEVLVHQPVSNPPVVSARAGGVLVTVEFRAETQRCVFAWATHCDPDVTPPAAFAGLDGPISVAAPSSHDFTGNPAGTRAVTWWQPAGLIVAEVLVTFSEEGTRAALSNR